MNLTKSYPLNQMAIGDYFVVRDRFQHARVAASEYARRHGMAFSCRMQEDGTMHVYRCENNQAIVDQRGSRGRRRIVRAVNEPSAAQFSEWLSTFAVGQSYMMPACYSHLFAAMLAWCELHSIKSNQCIAVERIGDELRITRTI